MNTLYFDCSSGISGDMTLGALTEILGDETYLTEELQKLHLPGWRIVYSKKEVHHLVATHVDVILEEPNHGHETDPGHSHGDGQAHTHRSYADITELIQKSDLSKQVKDLSLRIFLRVAKAESRVHDVPLEQVTFHEVGAVDSIIDIVGCAILICKLAPKHIYSSVVCDGYGSIMCAHGLIPVPVPATAEIFSDAHVPLKQVDVDTEMVTPTGAAIISELAEDFVRMPQMCLEKTGRSVGTREHPALCGLRVFAGEIPENRPGKAEKETGMQQADETDGYSNMGFAKLDTDRFARTGHAEVIFCEGKPDAYLQEIFKKLYEKNGEVLGTRASMHQYELIKEVLDFVTYDEVSHILKAEKEKRLVGNIVICTGGTADIPVAEEAALTAEFMGSKVDRVYDVGVAGMHRLLGESDRLKKATVIIAVAGMEGALPSVAAGLVSVPVIGVPTSVGYGTGADGYAATLGMLNSCANGVSVVNIDNGYGAAYIADCINKASFTKNKNI